MCKVLVLGDGWEMYKYDWYKPRCIPCDSDEWQRLVKNALREQITFLDFDKNMHPDVVENIGNRWKDHFLPESFDVVIDAVTHLQLKERSTTHFWDSVKHVLKDEGIFYGWGPNKQRLKIRSNEIDNYILATYGTNLFTPDKRYKCFHENILQDLDSNSDSSSDD